MSDEPETFPGDARLGRGHSGKRINLLRLAQAQRRVLFCILAAIVVNGSNMYLSRSGTPIGVTAAWAVLYGALALFTIVCVTRLALAYGIHPFMAILGSILSALPCVGILFLITINQKVNHELSLAKVKVGLLGVGSEEMNKLRVGVCLGCGYDLRGLDGPVCPECGQVRVHSE